MKVCSKNRICLSMGYLVFVLVLTCFALVQATEVTRLNGVSPMKDANKTLIRMSHEEIFNQASWLKFAKVSEANKAIEEMLILYFGGDYKDGIDAYKNGETRWEPVILFTKYDLNEDGVIDIVAQINTPYSCGVKGYCPTVILLGVKKGQYQLAYNDIGGSSVGVINDKYIVFGVGGGLNKPWLFELIENNQYVVVKI